MRVHSRNALLRNALGRVGLRSAAGRSGSDGCAPGGPVPSSAPRPVVGSGRSSSPAARLLLGVAVDRRDAVLGGADQQVVASGAHEVQRAARPERQRGEARQAGAGAASLAPGLDLLEDPRQPPDHGDHDQQADDRAHDARAPGARVRAPAVEERSSGSASPPCLEVGVKACAGQAPASRARPIVAMPSAGRATREVAREGVMNLVIEGRLRGESLRLSASPYMP